MLKSFVRKQMPIAILGAVSLAIFGPQPALAQDAAFVGTWASSEAQCALPQEDPGAPMVVTQEGFDQNEVHCKFSSVTPEADMWKISSTCSVQGDEQAHDFTFAVAGDKLTVTDELGTNDMIRCK